MNLQKAMLLYCQEIGHSPFPEVESYLTNPDGFSSLLDELAAKWGCYGNGRIEFEEEAEIIEVDDSHCLIKVRRQYYSTFGLHNGNPHTEIAHLVIPNSLARITELPDGFPAWLEAKRIEGACGQTSSTSKAGGRL